MSDQAPPARHTPRLLAAVVVLLGAGALLVPLWPDFAPEWRVGSLLSVAAVLQMIDAFRRDTEEERRGAWMGGAITFGMGLLLMNAPFLMGRAIAWLVAGWFALDAARHLVRLVRAFRRGGDFRWELAAMIGNLTVVALILWPGSGRLWTVAIAGALRVFGTAADILRARSQSQDEAGEKAAAGLRLADHPELIACANRIEQEELSRAPFDRGWIWTFLITLFAIHLGRMGFDQSALGILSPAFAVFGDVVVGFIAAFAIVMPGSHFLRRVAAPVERRAWLWCLAGDPPSRFKLPVRVALTRRLRVAIRLRLAVRSLRAALGRGLQTGLPVAAVIAATSPMFGMSWYFDTENWAAGIWDSWAEARTDVWREAMVRAVSGADGPAKPGAFSLRPPGVGDGADFSFVVIGDTGEGDPSQHVLRDQIIDAMEPEDARFLLISSDVVYPTGAMKDYERNFWLPFKGVRKPVYAIPGNHDWYDALEAFAATFMDGPSALLAMRARADADRKLTSRGERHFERLVREAGRLRGEYGVPTGFQRAPFFEIQTREFALFAIDTGVRRTLDPAQMEWLEAALGAAGRKFKLAILGHPFYAVGEYQAAGNAEFAALHALLRKHGVRVVMAGDTHDLEYYAEPAPATAGGEGAMHHFVNGGGGAFLSIGAALTPPERMPTREWLRYPSQPALVGKITALSPLWKKPVWWWTRWLNGWPWSAEWLSAAFDYNVSPFFQSFFVIRVEASRRRVVFMPWGVHGRLKWREVESSGPPAGARLDDPVEWVFPMTSPET